MTMATSACSTFDSLSERITGPKVTVGTVGFVRGFLGGAVADEPQAAIAARSVLSAGGTAADAAVAIAFTLAVTLPSRAALGSGGVCLAFAPQGASKVPEAFMFVSPAASPGAGSDRPAAVPMLARGMFAVHARYGRRPFETLTAGAEQLARFGAPVSRAFARDLAVVAAPLGADPTTADIFLPRGRTPAEGDILLQPDLAATIGQLRVSGVGDLYVGALARRVAENSGRAGGTIAADDLRRAIPQVVSPLRVPLEGGDSAWFPPPPADGGLAAAAGFKLLRANPTAFDAAAARAAGVVTRWRQGGYGGDVQAALDASDSAPGGLPPLPASTAFATLDREGNAVACVLTMNNLFGTGRVVPQTGILLAASPNTIAPPLLAMAMVTNTNIDAFRGVITGTGQSGAAMAVASGLAQTLVSRSLLPTPVPEPGRANAIFCPRYLPGPANECVWASDPRGNGLAVGSN